MAIKNNRPDILHRIRCKLYHSYLLNTRGKYLARASNESSLSVEQICASLKDRAGYTGDYEDLVKSVNQFLDEGAYLLCDGYALNLGYYSVHPNIGGTFNSPNEDYNRKKNPVDFRFRVNAALRNLAQLVAVEIEGLANVKGYIDKFMDTDENSENALMIPGNQFKILGDKIKIAGDNPETGVYFVSADDSLKKVKVERIAENSSVMIIGIIPKTKYRMNRIEIRTQYNGSGYFLKEPRVISSDFVLEQA